MSQMNLFQAERPVAEPRPSNPDFVRRHLNRLLRTARGAERMPWSPSEAESWRALFPQLAEALPPEERQELNEAFESELDRLKAA